MKIIKTFVTIALLNAVLVIGVISIGFGNKPTNKINPSQPGKPTNLPKESPVTSIKLETTPTTTPKTTSGCIVMIDKVKYDVTSLRRTHSGGDIFVCGTDMSREFWREHNSRILQRMQQYRVN